MKGIIMLFVTCALLHATNTVEVRVPCSPIQLDDGLLSFMCPLLKNTESKCYEYIYAMSHYCCEICMKTVGYLGWRPKHNTAFNPVDQQTTKAGLNHPTPPKPTHPAATLPTASATHPTKAFTTCRCDDARERYDLMVCETVKDSECLEMNTTSQCCVKCLDHLLNTNSCTPSCVSHPGDIKYGSFLTRSYQVNQTPVYTCRPAYILEQSDQPIACQYKTGGGGVWVGHLPTCRPSTTLIGSVTGVVGVILILMIVVGIVWRVRRVRGIEEDGFRNMDAEIRSTNNTSGTLSASRHTVDGYELVNSESSSTQSDAPNSSSSARRSPDITNGSIWAQSYVTSVCNLSCAMDTHETEPVNRSYTTEGHEPELSISSPELDS